MSTDLPSALAALQASPQDPAAWKTLGLMIIAQGMPDQLALFDQREAQAGDSVALMFKALFNDEFAQNPPLRHRLTQFADHVPIENPVGVVIKFFAACARLYDEDAGGAQAFRDAADGIARDPARFAVARPLARAPHFAPLITTPEETQRLWSSWGGVPAQEIVWSETPLPSAGSEPLIFAACDGGYLERFGERFLDVVRGLGPVHIHVVNPGPDQLRDFATKVGSGVLLSHERVGEDRSNSQYYACARFFAAEAVMDRYGRDLWMMDIDLERLAHLDDLSPGFGEADVAYFAMPTLMPWLRHHAAFIHLKNNPSVRGFLNRFANLLSHQLPGAVWYVDQLCLGSTVSAYRHAAEELKIAPLEQADGFPFAHFVIPAGEDAEKEALRRKGSV